MVSAKNDLSLLSGSVSVSPNQLAFGVRFRPLLPVSHDRGLGILGTNDTRDDRLTKMVDQRSYLQAQARVAFAKVDASTRLRSALSHKTPSSGDPLVYGDKVWVRTDSASTYGRQGVKGPWTVLGGTSQCVILSGAGSFRSVNRYDVRKIEDPDSEPALHIQQGQ